MSGCARAIAERDRLRQMCQPLAYWLHTRMGFKCRRAGGHSVCGACVGDLVPSDKRSGDERASLSAVKGKEASSQRPERFRLSRTTVGEI